MDAAAALRDARVHAGLSQAELATRAGTSQATVSAYENGRKEPTVATFERLLRAGGARLTVEVDRPVTRVPSRRDLQAADRALQDTLALAAALPVRHHAELRHPPLRPR